MTVTPSFTSYPATNSMLNIITNTVYIFFSYSDYCSFWTWHYCVYPVNLPQSLHQLYLMSMKYQSISSLKVFLLHPLSKLCVLQPQFIFAPPRIAVGIPKRNSGMSWPRTARSISNSNRFSWTQHRSQFPTSSIHLVCSPLILPFSHLVVSLSSSVYPPSFFPPVVLFVLCLLFSWRSLTENLIDNHCGEVSRTKRSNSLWHLLT